MKCIDKINDPGDSRRPNEDIAGFTGNTAWVIDGATGVTDRLFAATSPDSDARWLAQKIDAKFRMHAGRFQEDLAGLLRQTLLEIRGEFNTLADGKAPDFFEYPCASLQICHAGKDIIHVASLGDCILMVEDEGVVMVHGGDPEHHRADDKTINLYRDFRSQGRNHAEARQDVLPNLRGVRATLNSNEGFGVFNAGQDALKIRRASFPVSSKAEIILMSDGFYRLRDVYKIYETDSAFMTAIQTKSLTDLCKDLRGIEAMDNENHTLRYRCLKVSDDATALRMGL